MKSNGLVWRIIEKNPHEDIAGAVNVKPLSVVIRMAWEISQVAA